MLTTNTEAQRRASQGSLALTDERLEEYRRLYVSEALTYPVKCSSRRIRKAQASVLAVEERQSLETLSRDEKTSSRGLAQLRDKIEQLSAKKAKLAEDEDTAKTRRTEVDPLLLELAV